MTIAIHQRSFLPPEPFIRSAEASRSVHFASQDITEIFHSSAPIDSSAANLSEKQIVSFSNLWKDPITAIFGGLWSLLLLFDVYSAVDSGVKFMMHLKEGASLGSMQERAGAESGLIGDLFCDLKQFIVSSISLAGVTANLGDWAHQQRVVSLGQAMNAFRLVGYGASCITSSVRACSSGKEVLVRLRQFKEVKHDGDLARLEQKQFLSCLELASNGATALWAFMGIALLVSGVATAPAWLIGFSNVAGILAICALFYQVHMINLYPAGER